MPGSCSSDLFSKSETGILIIYYGNWIDYREKRFSVRLLPKTLLITLTAVITGAPGMLPGDDQLITADDSNSLFGLNGNYYKDSDGNTFLYPDSEKPPIKDTSEKPIKTQVQTQGLAGVFWTPSPDSAANYFWYLQDKTYVDDIPIPPPGFYWTHGRPFWPRLEISKTF